MDPLIALIMLPGLAIGLTLHEFAHAWSASLLGDDFPRRQKRVSLNPFRHLSLLGTLAIFLLPIGWGKPVLLNVYNFRRPKLYYLLTSLAGPAANLAVVGICLLLMQLTRRTYLFGPRYAPLMNVPHLLLELIALINVILATINLLPIPPLDGSKIWPCLIPGVKISYERKLSLVSMGVLMVLMWTGAPTPIFEKVTELVHRLAPETQAQQMERLVKEGAAAHADKQLSLAEQRFTEALALDSRNQEALVRRALVRRDLGNLAAAVEDITQAIGAYEHSAYYMLRSVFYEGLDMAAEAQADREQARQCKAAEERWDATVRSMGGDATPHAPTELERLLQSETQPARGVDTQPGK